MHRLTTTRVEKSNYLIFLSNLSLEIEFFVTMAHAKIKIIFGQKSKNHKEYKMLKIVQGL